MSTLFITFGLTCFNAGDSIEAAVASAFAQVGDFEFEVIVVDDCSNEGTIRILQNLEQAYPSLVVIYQNENKGVAASRNMILAHAKGEFIAFFDDDDVSMPDRVEKQHARIMGYEHDFVICYTARTQIYPDGLRHYEPTMGMDVDVAPHGDGVALRILTGKPVKNGFGSMATCSQMARAEVFRALGGFDERFQRSEDTDFSVRAALKGAHFVGIAAPLVTQTMTHGSDKKLSAELQYTLQLLEKHRDFIERYTSYAHCRKWIVAKYEYLHGRKAKFIFQVFTLLLTNPVFTLKRLYWALPNMGFNSKSRQFYHDDQ